MVAPFVTKVFEGLVGSTTASFYRLNQFGIPIRLITDIDPIPTPDRATLDMIDSESSPDEYDVTENPLQDFSAATSNVSKKLQRMEIVGTLSSAVNLGLLGSIGLGNLPGQLSPLRKDLQVLKNLRAMADRREPIMVVTPRHSMPLAFIRRIADDWTPDIGQNTIVSISLVECRIVDPLTADSVVADVGNSHTGNNRNNPAGGQSGSPIETQDVKAAPAPGAAPSVVAIQRVPA